MNKILSVLLIIQLGLIMFGCCCPCAQKQAKQNQETSQEAKQEPSK